MDVDTSRRRTAGREVVRLLRRFIGILAGLAFAIFAGRAGKVLAFKIVNLRVQLAQISLGGKPTWWRITLKTPDGHLGSGRVLRASGGGGGRSFLAGLGAASSGRISFSAGLDGGGAAFASSGVGGFSSSLTSGALAYNQHRFQQQSNAHLLKVPNAPVQLACGDCISAVRL